MPSILPAPFLFQFALPIRRVTPLPRTGKSLLDLPPECALPNLQEAQGATPFGELRVAWNDEGLGLQLIVTGKRQPPVCRADVPTESDGLQVWIDTRNTQSIHRAGRHCHAFCLLPLGGGKAAKDALVAQRPIARAKEDASTVADGVVRSAATVSKTGYVLESWFPAAALHGYDPETCPRLGFTYHLRDGELGDQYLTVGRDFPFAHDPSLWSTLELSRTS